jgi:hypothetical protein
VRRALHATAATLSLSGTNLGMWTKYRGADPNVNSSAVGDQLTDFQDNVGGTIPQTRNWSMALRLGF